MTQSWYEVWADEGLTPPYVLLVLAQGGRSFVIFDPKDNKIIHEAPAYENVKLWLLEDEYRRVDGRMVADELE
jgi:hypothetical protein